MTAELIALTDELRATNGLLLSVTDRLDKADERAELAEKRAKRHRFGSWVLAAVVLAVVLLGWRDIQQRKADEIAACRRANETRADIRASIVDTVLVIIQGTDDPDALAPLVTQVQDRLTETLPDRSC